MPRSAPQFRHIRRSGFTLLELLIVGVVGILVVGLSTNASRWYVRSVHEINVATQLNKQLKLASESIAQDMGAALAMKTTSGSDLQFDLDDGDGIAQWASPDTVVQYTLSNGYLIRHDLATDDQTVVAYDVTTFTVTANGAYLDVHIATSYRTDQQDITLELRGS